MDGWSVVSDSYEGSVKNGKEHTITGAGNVSLWYCSDHVENNNRTYACSVVALCNLAKYYRERGYDKISRSLLHCTILCGRKLERIPVELRRMAMKPCCESVLEDLGYSCSYDSYLFDNYSDFTRTWAIINPALFTYGAKFGSKSGGHTLFWLLAM